MQPEILKYLEDISLSLSRIEFHLAEISSFEQFAGSWTVYDAVERRLAIIGEAVWKIDKFDKDFQITDKRKIIGLRHILTHEYNIVSSDVIWKIIQVNLPVLKTEIITYLNN
jgi:uncharacterized protein with HEPN domain